MLNYTYVDNSNVFIEGRRFAAVQRGLAKDMDDAMKRKIGDTSWNIDYGKLHEFVCGAKNEIGGAKLWGSPPPGDSFWKMVESKGFQVKTFDKVSGNEKIDKADSEITLVSGDKDFVPVSKTW